MGLRDRMQKITASLQQTQDTQQPQLPLAGPLAAVAAAPPAAAPAVAAVPAQPPPKLAAPPPPASQQPSIVATGLTRVSLVRQAQLAAASQAAAATQQAAAAAPLSQIDASQGYNQDDYIWIGGRRIRKECTGGRAQPSLSQPPASQLQQAQPQQAEAPDGIDRGAARAVVAVPAGKDAFDDAFDLGPLPRAAGGGSRASGGSKPKPRAAPAHTSDSEEDALLGLLPRPSPKAASKQRGKRGGTAAAPGGSARKAPAGGASRAQARKGAAPKRKARSAVTQESGDDEGSEEEAPRPSQRRARGAGGGGRKRKQPDAEEEGEGGTQPGGLLDQLLAEESQEAAAPAPIAAPVDRPAGGAGAGRGGQQPHGQAQQQQQQPRQQRQQQQAAPPPRPPALRPNAPTDGPDEDMILRADEDGTEVPLDAPEDPFLELVVPASINKYLRSYQRDGIRFLFRQYARGIGGVLADDMGLGKTIQAIGFIAALLSKTGGPEDAYLPELPRLDPLEAPLEESYELLAEEWEPRYDNAGAPILVVAPTSVLSNWEREFETWGHFRVVLCHAGQRDSALAGILHGKKEIMIISYDTMRTMEESILTVPWHAVIFDEAHLLKNDKAQRYQIANRLPTRLRYGLTGTPFQNDYAEIFNVMDFFAPDCLGAKKDFNRDMARPIMRGQKSTASDEQIADGKEAQRALRTVLQEYMLRRTKALIAEQLPKKLDKIVFCELTPLQLRAYQRVLQAPDMELIMRYRELPCPGCGGMEEYFKCCGWRVDEDQGGVLWPMYHLCECEDPGPYDKDLNPKGCKSHKPEGCWRMTKFGWRRMCPFCLVLPICSILRKISNHMELVKAEHTDRETAPMKFGKALQIAQLVIGDDEEELGGYVTTEEFLRLRDTSTCGKMQVLVSLLDTWAAEGGNKVLLFSNSVRLLRILHSLLDARAYDYLMLDGSVAQQDRQAMVDQFNNSPSTFVFLISSNAGGVGLNLTAANKVIIFDPSWNPAVDLQAQDRAFRLGQRRDVSVYRFVAAGTMEEMIYSRQLYKQQHSKMVLEGARMPRMWEGAKTTDKQDQGELWGMHNLLRMNAEGILSLDRLEEQRQRRARGVRMEDYDADEAVQRGARANATAAESDEDAGLEALVEEEMAALVEAEGGGNEEGAPTASRGGTGGSQAPNGAVSGGSGSGQEGSQGGSQGLAPGELLAREAAEVPLNDAQRREAEVLRAAGITGTMLHTLAFTGAEDEQEEAVVERVGQQRSQAAAAQAAAAATNAAKRPRQLQSARQAKYAATAAVGAGSGLVQQQELPLLESLAQLMGLSVQEATSVLLNMTPEQRAELRRGFAAQDDPSVGPSGGSKGSKQGSGGPGGSRGAGTVAAEEAAAEAADGLETDGGSEGRGMDPDDGLDPEFAAPD